MQNSYWFRETSLREYRCNCLSGWTEQQRTKEPDLPKQSLECESTGICRGAVWGTFSHTRCLCFSLFLVDFSPPILPILPSSSSEGDYTAAAAEARSCVGWWMWGWSPEVLEQHQTDDKMEGGWGELGCRMEGRGVGGADVGWLRIVYFFLFVRLILYICLSV